MLSQGTRGEERKEGAEEPHREKCLGGVGEERREEDSIHQQE